MARSENIDLHSMSNHELATLNLEARQDTKGLLFSAGFTLLANLASVAVALETEGKVKQGAELFAIGALLGTVLNFILAMHKEDVAIRTHNELLTRLR